MPEAGDFEEIVIDLLQAPFLATFLAADKPGAIPSSPERQFRVVADSAGWPLQHRCSPF